jgi:hypothetical protein
MTVTNYKYFRLGDLVRLYTGEIVRVATTPSSTTVTIARAFGETSAAAADSGGQLLIIGSAFAEGADKADFVTTQRAQKVNYCAIHKTAYGATETNIATKQVAGQDMMTEEQKKLIEHRRAIELMLWFGELKLDSTTATHPIRGMKGVFAWISTNASDFSGGLTEPEFEDWLRGPFRYGSKERFAFLSPRFVSAVNRFGREKIKTMSGEGTYGLTMSRYEFAGRKLALIEHKLFEDQNLGDKAGDAGVAGLSGFGALLDVLDLKVRYMRGQLVGEKKNVQANGEDQVINQYLSEFSLQFGLEKKHAKGTGVKE